MSKLIAKFRAVPSIDNAKRLVAYLDRHMMAECMATADDNAAIAQARALIGS